MEARRTHAMIRAMETLSVRQVRRLALAKAGLLKPDWIGLPSRAAGRGSRARGAAGAIVRHFGYLQLDTVSIAGARSHALVLLSRLEGMDPALGEELLRPGEPLFEYWGHEASWIPLELYPAFEFRRRAFRRHRWWAEIVGQHPKVARNLRRRIHAEGPLRSIDMEGRGSRGWWDLKTAKRVAAALWSSGELAIRERKNFQRTFDLAQRVIPDEVRNRTLSKAESIELLLLKALDGHGWATSNTLGSTWRLTGWRLTGERKTVDAALRRLVEKQTIAPCALDDGSGSPTPGWIRCEDLELAARLERARPRRDRGVLLSPFDPVLWDRARVKQMFDFDQVLEIYKPAHQREYGYFCMPVLAGERLIARFDFKADRKRGHLRVLSCRFESTGTSRPGSHEDGEAERQALTRFAAALQLKLVGWSSSSRGKR